MKRHIERSQLPPNLARPQFSQDHPITITYRGRKREIQPPPSHLWQETTGKGLVTDTQEASREKYIASIGSRETRDRHLHLLEDVLRDFFSLFKTSSQYQDFGLSVVSGLAPGTDTVSHITALEYEEYDVTTIGVKGTPIDKHSLKSNRVLAEQIADSPRTGDAVVSEYAATGPNGHTFERFLERNRITTWLSGLVIGACIYSLNSGSMYTMRVARASKLPTFFIRETVSPQVAQELITLGAHPIDSAEEIFTILTR